MDTIFFIRETIIINKIKKVKKLEKKMRRLQRNVSKKYELNKKGVCYVKTINITKIETKIRKYTEILII